MLQTGLLLEHAMAVIINDDIKEPAILIMNNVPQESCVLRWRDRRCEV